MLGDALHDFKVALGFLTRLPVHPDRPWQGTDLAASVAMFPLVGALVGLVGALTYAFALTLGLPPLPGAVLAVTALVWLTGAMHEDGLGDLADSLGGATRESKLAIMRDSRVGSFGVIAIVLALLARISALAALVEPALVAAALLAAGAVSRAAMPVAMLVLPQAREDGLAASAGLPDATRVAAAGVIAMLIAVLLLAPQVAAGATLCAALAAVLVAGLAHRALGGITGDVLGAIQQMAEIAFLLGTVAALA